MLKNYVQKNIRLHLTIEDKEFILEGVDETDNFITLKREIEILTEIPAIYQCLFYSDHIPLGFVWTGEVIQISEKLDRLAEGRPLGEFIDQSHNLIGGEAKRVYVLNLRAFIEEELDPVFIREMSESEVSEFHDTVVRRYWPFMNLVNLRLAFEGHWHKGMTSSGKQVSNRNIFSISVESIKKVRGFGFTIPEESGRKIVSKFNLPQNLVYFFDQFQLSKKYYSAVIKINEAVKYRRYLLANTQVSEPAIPKTVGILINDIEIFIRSDGTVIHETMDILTDAEDLFVGTIVEQKTRSVYTFSVVLPIKLDTILIGKMIESYGSVIERDYKNYSFEHFISFYYKKIDISSDDYEYTQAGAYVKIMGRQTLTVIVNNVKSRSEIVNIFNFIIRFFFIYHREYHLQVSHLREEGKIKSNLKVIDPKLFSQENLYDVKHTRLCQKDKQPYGYIVGSEQYEFFKGDPKNKDPLSNQLLFHNITHPDKISAYMCMNKKFPYPIFISSLIQKNGVCVPCCSSINKRKSPEFQRCIGQSDIEIRESNNLYYISRYNPEKIMKRRRLVYLPDLFHRSLNAGIKLKTFIAPGEDLFILSGMTNSAVGFEETVRELTSSSAETGNTGTSGSIFDHYLSKGIAIVIIRLSGELDEGGRATGRADYSIVNTYDNVSTINNIQSNLVIYILETRGKIYYPILHLTLNKDRKYSTSYLHDRDSKIGSIISGILGKTAKIDKGLNFTDYKQIRGDIPNICNSIFVGGVVLPINPRAFNVNFPIIDRFEWTNKLDDLLSLGLESKTDLIQEDRDGVEYFIGQELADGNLVFFKAEKLARSKGKRVNFLMKIDRENKNKSINSEFPVNIDPEIYNVLLLHVATYINISYLPSSVPHGLKEWNALLVKHYGEGQSTDFINDYVHVKNKEYGKLELFKKYKREIIKNLNEDATKSHPDKIESILESCLSPHISFIKVEQTKGASNIRKVCTGEAGEGTSSYTITNQCDKRGSLQIEKGLFNKYIRLIAWEINKNELKRKLIFDNILPKIVSFGHFSYQEGTKVVKL